jgi:hypothetical protein
VRQAIPTASSQQDPKAKSRHGCSPMLGEPSRPPRPADRLIVLSDEDELESMVDRLLDRGRSEVVVAVSASTEAGRPVLSHEEIQSVVGRDARVFLIADEFLLARLEGALGPRLALREDALRVWWPGLSTRSDAGDHPEVHVMDAETAEGLLDVFGTAFDLSRPRVREAIELNSQLGSVEARSLTLAIQRAERAEAVAAEAAFERDQARVRAYQAELMALSGDEIPMEKRLHVLIWRDWLTRLDARQRREQYLNYILSEQFVHAVEAQPALDLDRLAWVCMMLASRCELKGSGLDAHPLFAGRRRTHQVAREDGLMKRPAPGCDAAAFAAIGVDRCGPVVAVPGVLVDVLRRGAWDAQERLGEALTDRAVIGVEMDRRQRQEHRAKSDSLWELIDALDQHSTGQGGSLSVDLKRYGRALALSMARVQEDIDYALQRMGPHRDAEVAEHARALQQFANRLQGLLPPIAPSTK